MGRLEHLKQTLPRNLLGNPNTDDVGVEFVVLNYGDKDGMHEWMTTDTQVLSEIEAGRLIYARTDQPVFRMAHAKNMAHRLATGDVVCNVDADNFTGEGFAEALADLFAKKPNVILNPSYRVSFSSEQEGGGGLFGRMALTRSNFERLGGYDESYSGWGSEDTNLSRRARMLGIHYVRFENNDFLGIIHHGDDERVQNMFTDDASRQREKEKVVFYKKSSGLQKIWKASKDRLPIFVRSLAANGGTHFGLGHVDFLNTNDTDFDIKPLKGTKVSLFDEIARVGYMRNLLRDRLEPNVISLKGPDARP
tara:strand:- start:870 stop:1790 length:921 start_codon:yes stop_codon:yes gene_type:complete